MDQTFNWILPNRKYIVIGTGRSGTGVVVHALAQATGRIYKGEILAHMDDTSPSNLFTWLDANFPISNDRIHKISIRQTHQDHLYPYLVQFLRIHQYHMVFLHRNPLDCFRSELVINQTRLHYLRTEQSPTAINWPSETPPRIDTAQYVARTQHKLMKFRGLVPESWRSDLHYTQIDALCQHLKVTPDHIALSQFYPQWDVAGAAHMLFDAMLETYDGVWKPLPLVEPYRRMTK